METLKKKYGLATATAMVVGIVIGSGVFFKAEKILSATGGNLSIGILAWIIGGIIMNEGKQQVKRRSRKHRQRQSPIFDKSE